MRLRAAAALVAALALTGCTDDDLEPVPEPPPTVPARPTTTVPDYSGVALTGVPGRTTTTAVALGPGRATIAGTVTGPEGPVAGATVSVERLVGEATGTARAVTNADGTFALPGITGGRYRVRAFRPPDLAQVTAEVFFLAADQSRTVALALERHSGYAVTSDIAPDPPVQGERANLVVLVARRAVDEQGVVRADPAPGLRVNLAGTGTWRVEGSLQVVTDAGGRASWRVVCGAEGEQPLSVVVNGEASVPLALPPCSPPPEEPAPPGSTTTTAANGSTTTTRPRTATTGGTGS